MAEVLQYYIADSGGVGPVNRMGIGAFAQAVGVGPSGPIPVWCGATKDPS